MQFTVPKFIENKPKIVGPFTFKQFIFIGTAGGVCLFLYFILPPSLFVIIAVFLVGSASALAFVKIKKTPLPIVIKNFFFYLLSTKIYLWKKKTSLTKSSAVSKKSEEEDSLRVEKGGRLKQLFSRIETKKTSK